MSETRKAIMERLGMAAKARFEENCGTGAGGFQPGNKCGAEDGKGGGGAAPDAKKRKRKPKRTPLAGPKVEKPAKIPSVQALEDIAVSNQPYYRWDWEAAEDALSGRTDPQAKALRDEMSALVKRWDELTDVITDMEWGSSRKNRSATKRKATADELNLLQQRAKRIIRDAQKTEKTAKRSTVEQAGALISQTIKAQDSIASYEAMKDVRDAIEEARKRGGAGSGKMRKSLKAMEEEWRGLERETEVINSDYTAMKERETVDPKQAQALKERARQLLRKTGDWRKRAQALVGQAKARASRTGDKRLMAAAVRAQKILARRPGPRTRFGFLDRIGRAATALTARPADTTAPDYASQVEEAKKAAISEVNGYRFLRDKVVARQQAMDAYVKQAAAAIAKSRVAPDIRHFTDQIRTAVKAQQMMLFAVKTPFGRKGAKAKFSDGAGSFLTINGVRYRIVGTRKDARGNLVYDLQGTSKTAHPVPFTLVKFLDDERWVLWGAHGGEVARGKMEASRPGAKAKQMQAKYGGTVTMEDKQVAAKPERKAKNCTVDAKPLAYGKGEGALEREDVKAGLKLMSASDPAVSDKIRTLIKEGKPQEQAVAIALDMKRRGEL